MAHSKKAMTPPWSPSKKTPGVRSKPELSIGLKKCILKKKKNPHFCLSKDIPFPGKIDTSLHECSESICCITSFAENVYFVFLDLRLEMETNSQFLVEVNCYFIWMWFKHLLPRKIRTLLNWFHGGLCLPAQVRQRKLAVMQDNNKKKKEPHLLGNGQLFLL